MSKGSSAPQAYGSSGAQSQPSFAGFGGGTTASASSAPNPYAPQQAAPMPGARPVGGTPPNPNRPVGGTPPGMTNQDALSQRYATMQQQGADQQAQMQQISQAQDAARREAQGQLPPTWQMGTPPPRPNTAPPPGGPAQQLAYNQLLQVKGDKGQGTRGQAMSAYARQYGTDYDPRGTIGGSNPKALARMGNPQQNSKQMMLSQALRGKGY